MATFSLQQRHAELDQHNAELLIRIAHDTGATPITPPKPGALPGDEQALRGIPAIGRNVAGAIPGTNPATLR